MAALQAKLTCKIFAAWTSANCLNLLWEIDCENLDDGNWAICGTNIRLSTKKRPRRPRAYHTSDGARKEGLEATPESNAGIRRRKRGYDS